MLKDRARWAGALAGVVPAGVLAGLFAVAGSSASTAEQVTSLGLVGIITIGAGWIAGPLAAAEPRALARAAIGYAIALIAMMAALAVTQGVVDTVSADGLNPGAVLAAFVGRTAYALAATAYLIIPALVLAAPWIAAVRLLLRNRRGSGSG